VALDDAYAACRFYVQIDGQAQALFTELSGLQTEIVVQEYEEVGNNGYIHRLPGRAKVGNITLKRGMTRSNDFLKWLLDVANGKITRRNVTVVMYDTKREVLLRWNFLKAYPVKWSGPQFTAKSSDAAVESLELAHDGMTLG
jgi:phage tail-like protein